jgi:hypothetical protein
MDRQRKGWIDRVTERFIKGLIDWRQAGIQVGRQAYIPTGRMTGRHKGIQAE